MGTAHVLMHPRFIDKICQEHASRITVVERTDYGDGLYLVLLSSDLIPTGFNGEMELSIHEGRLRFKKGVDT